MASPGGGEDVQVSVSGGPQAAMVSRPVALGFLAAPTLGAAPRSAKAFSLSPERSITLEFPVSLWPLFSEALSHGLFCK